MRQGLRAAVLAAVAVGMAQAAQATDPARGQRLFMTPPVAGELACADCHSEQPVANNFGNIWSGRNAVSLIQRAVSLNTGGMGVFSRYYGDAELADIAAYLGNAPVRLDFGETVVGQRSLPQRVVISASTKLAIDRLSLQVEGDFERVSPPCPAQLPRFGECVVELVFAPSDGGPRDGRLLIAHDGLPTPAAVVLAGAGRSRPPAVVTLSTAALDFGVAAAGTESPARQLRLSNLSPQPLSLGVIDLTSPAFVIDGGDCHAGRVLTTGRFCVLSLRFVPRTADAHAALLRLRHDGAGGVSEVALQGRALPAPAPALQGSRQVLRFAATGDRATLRLHNGGPLPVRLGGLSVSHAGFNLLPGGCATGAVLPAGAGCDLGVQHAEGPAAGELRITHDGSAEPERVVLSLQPLPDAPGDADTPLQVDAGALALAAGERRELQLANRGAVPLALAAPRVIGAPPVQVVGGSCRPGEALAPSASCTFELMGLAPPAGPPPRGHLRLEAGDLAALLGIESALPAAPSTAPAPGERWMPAAGRLALWPQAIVFPAAPGVAGGRQRVWIENVGAGLLPVRAVALQGGGFTLDRPARDGCPADGLDLLPGRGCAVDVLWTAGLDVRFGAELQVAVAGEDQPRRVPLSVAESAAARSNQGGGGALRPGALALLVLALAVLRFAPGRRRARSESPHA